MPSDDEVDILLASMPETIRGRFTKLERIGRGGTGIVYKGWDTMLKRHFALKVLHPDQATDKRILQLHREAKTLCQLQHPNIVSVFNFIVTDSGKPILVMELVEGQSLESYIDQNGPLSIDQNLEIILQICAAIEYAHVHGVLHRDLSPSNILLRKNKNGGFEIKVVDFGISKVENVQDRTIVKSGQLVGNVTVISPEQARAQKTDQRSDIYSLGCLMYKAVSGTFPFRGKTILETIDKHINAEIPTIESKCPSALKDVIYKAMQKRPEDRFQCIAEMREAIEDIVRLESDEDGVEIDETGAGAASQQPKPIQSLNSRSVQKKNTTAILIGIVIVAIIPIVAIAYMFINQPPSKIEPVEAPKRSESDVQITTKNDQKWLSATNPQVTTFPRSLFSELDKNPQIHRVALTNVHLSDEQLKKLCAYNLEILDLKNTTINDHSLEVVSKCSSLRSLLLRNCRNITDFGIGYLHPMKKLIIISVSDTAIGSKGLIPLLQANKNLKVVHATGCNRVKEDIIPVLLALPKLDSVRLGSTGVGRSGARTLLNKANQVGFMGLGSLNLEDSDIPEHGPYNLTRLEISKNPKLTEVAFKRIKTWPHLSFLNIDGCDGIPNNTIEEAEENFIGNHLLIAPSIMFDWERDDTEAYLEPTLYDRCGTNQLQLTMLIVKWSREKREALDGY